MRPTFAVGVAVAKYADHLPLERQVRMMAREGLLVESQTLWDQLNALAHHLEPTYEALGRRALEAPVINVDETRWAIMGSAKPAAGTVWTVRTPTESFYRILPGKSTDEGRQVLAGYRGIAVVDGFAVYEVLARDGPGFTLAHCWAHAKRKFGDIAEQWPVACDEIAALIGELYAIERDVPGPFPGDAEAQALRHQLRHERSRLVLDRIWHWATVQVGLPRSDFGKAVRYMLERWDGLTRFLTDRAHSARQQCRRTRPTRSGGRPQESLRIPLAPRDPGRGALLHALRNRTPGRRRCPRVPASRGRRDAHHSWHRHATRRLLPTA